MPKPKRTATVQPAKLKDLTFDEDNVNKGTERGSAMLADSLQQLGAGRSIVIDRNNRIIAGNKTAEQAGQAGLEDVLVVETDGKQLVAVKRTDLDMRRDRKARRLAVADNRVGEANLAWDMPKLKEMDVDLKGLWSDYELAQLMRDFPETTDDDVKAAAAADIGPDDGKVTCPQCGAKFAPKST